MTLKKMIYINTIITFALAFLIHFAYEIIPNNFTAIFFSVNESIWEHMKMLYTTVLLYGIIEYFLLKKYYLHYNNLLIITVIKSIIIIPIYLIMFLPLYYLMGENFIIAISIMLISIYLVNYLGYIIANNYKIRHQKIIGISLIIIVYIIMGILTFKPPKTMLFLDTQKNIYGINIKK